MEELCIPLQDFLQDSCKILNLSITRVSFQNCWLRTFVAVFFSVAPHYFNKLLQKFLL